MFLSEGRPRGKEGARSVWRGEQEWSGRERRWAGGKLGLPRPASVERAVWEAVTYSSSVSRSVMVLIVLIRHFWDSTSKMSSPWQKLVNRSCVKELTTALKRFVFEYPNEGGSWRAWYGLCSVPDDGVMGWCAPMTGDTRRIGQ